MIDNDNVRQDIYFPVLPYAIHKPRPEDEAQACILDEVFVLDHSHHKALLNG